MLLCATNGNTFGVLNAVMNMIEKGQVMEKIPLLNVDACSMHKYGWISRLPRFYSFPHGNDILHPSDLSRRQVITRNPRKLPEVLSVE